ncbi:lysyl-tRNA synthetase-like protein [Hortaea werneckii]|nr:lysyl-tRNA synthetase-like protein [Hortaea werneckii]
MLANPSSVQPLFVRHHIVQALRDHLNKTHFVEVTTPLLTAGAGGAVARPFETEATELEGQKLNLRIAPELWLKRLIVGGMSRIYEIGPAFRNEGVDATHNPEFTICEFYEACATLDSLMTKTEILLKGIKQRIDEARATASSDPVSSGFSRLKDLPGVELDLQSPFKRLEFIPALEEAMKTPLPNLSNPDAHENLLSLFTAKNLDIPTKPTLPRLLDALAAHYLEALCTHPTFITHHPAALSPLSKHFRCPRTGQTIAARAELFIRGREYANMYEEENSPFAQRRNFLEQLRYRAVDGEGDGQKEVDESYLEALEWGMPPTGGWGCGVDRLVMLFSGRERMSEVLAFGSLRNVVGLGRARR